MRARTKRSLIIWFFLAGIVPLLLFKPFLINFYNVIWLNTMFRSTFFASAWSSAFIQDSVQLFTPRLLSFRRGAVAWEQGNRSLALDYWKRDADAARLALYARGHPDACSLCGALGEIQIGAEALYECGMILAQHGENRQAMMLFDRVIADGQQTPFMLRSEVVPVAYSYAEIGKAYYRLGDEANALERLLLAETLLDNQNIPPPASLLTFIGLIYADSGQLDVAVQYLSRAPDDFYANLRLGDIGMMERDWPNAMTAYERAAHLRPSDPRPYLGLTKAYRNAGMLSQSEAARQQAIKLLKD